MHKRRVISLVILVVLALIMWASAGPALAAGRGTITIDQYSPGSIAFTFTATGNHDDDGFGNDFVAVAFLDSDCNPLFVLPWTVPAAHPPVPDTVGISMDIPFAVGPVTALLLDTHGPVVNYQELAPNDRFMDAASSDPEARRCAH